jgi:hypothetical protein
VKYQLIKSTCIVVLGLTSLGALATATTQPAAQTTAIGSESPWPLLVQSGNTTLTVYQPQLDAWDGYKMSARVAVQAAADQSPQMQYGIVALEAFTLTDKGRRVVTIDNAQIVKTDFPSASTAESQQWAAAIQRDLEGKSRSIALDRLEAALAVTEVSTQAKKTALRNEPPAFIFSTVPAILVYVDGEPRYRAQPRTSLERVINTRPLLLRDQQGVHYLKVFDGWMTANSLTGPWSILAKPSDDLGNAFEQTLSAHLIDPLKGQTTEDRPAPKLKKAKPAIYVATRPTELIVTDGKPRYAPIKNTQLLYVENTTGNVFKDISDNRVYVLVSGRWFRANNESGPWQYVAANALPEDFAKMPDDSPKENVKASIAGTQQAREAAIAAIVPQTATVKVTDTELAKPQFDGDPSYKNIPETSLQYVNNTATPIIRVESDSFFALQNGVWFVASSVHGPWTVARAVPAAIYAIPPSSPLYYVTFVHIYAVDGDIVYVGYTPGYQGAYIDPATGVVVYGTGYVYDPWIGEYWYGDPITYGYAASVAYTPWTGWAYGYGYGWYWGATIAYGWGWGAYPYWGAWAYPAWGVAWGAGGGAVAWGPYGWAGYTGNIYTQWGNRATVSRVAGGYNAWTGNAWATQVGGSYNSRTGVASAGQRGAVKNVYTGNFAAGGRGVATGPQGNAVVGKGGVAGNVYTGNAVAAGKGAVYNAQTGEWTSVGGAVGSGGGKAVRVGDDVYAGKDGNVYRNTGDGWEKRDSSGWQPARTDYSRDLNLERQARNTGAGRSQNLQQSSIGMQRSFGPGRGGGMRGGGGRRR